MSLIFNKDESVDDTFVSYHITNKDNDDIGTVEGSGNQNGVFVSVVKIYNIDFQKTGLGFKSFKKVFDEIDSIYPITVIKASWQRGGEFEDFEKGMSTNLLIFRNNLLEMNEKQSVFSTPTGKWVQKIGFSNYTIITNNDDNVIINFTKENP